MITLYTGRQRPADRIPSIGNKSGTEQVITYSDFHRGLDTSRSRFSTSDGSLLIADNVTIEPGGVSPRAGSRPIATGTNIRRLITYTPTNQTYAVSDTGIFEVTAGPKNPVPSPTILQALTSGHVSSVEFQNDAGKFLTIVNGADDLVLFDGTNWYSVNASSATHSITGVDTSDLTFGWTHQSHQYFIEGGTLNAWYLGPNSVSGAATKLPLAGVFSQSSELLFGGSFSTDSGSGLDDYNVFVTKEGEVAIYRGSDPASASTFSLKGVYKIPRPLNRNAHASLGGDLLIATVEGIIPVSSALSKDVGELSLYSISRNVDEDLRIEVDLSRSLSSARWNLVKSEYHNLMFLVLPRYNQPDRNLYVVNLTTRGWSRFTDWLVIDLVASGRNVFYTDGTTVYEALVTGRDDGLPIRHRICTAFSDFGADGRQKVVHKARVTSRSEFTMKTHTTIQVDLEINAGAYPAATPTIAPGDDVWGVDQMDTSAGIWDTARWAQTYKSLKVQADEASGYSDCNSAAVQMQFSSDGDTPLRAFVLGASLSFTIGASFA